MCSTVNAMINLPFALNSFGEVRADVLQPAGGQNLAGASALTSWTAKVQAKWLPFTSPDPTSAVGSPAHIPMARRYSADCSL